MALYINAANGDQAAVLPVPPEVSTAIGGTYRDEHLL